MPAKEIANGFTNITRHTEANHKTGASDMTTVRDLIDLKMVSRLSGIEQYLVRRYVRRHGPPPVGRVGGTMVWNSQDLDALLIAVEQGKARGKNKSLVVLVPDERDALASRLFLYRDEQQQPLLVRDIETGEHVELATLADAVKLLKINGIAQLEELCGDDQVKVARTLSEILAEAAGINTEDVVGA